jgi:hypothetical protein
MTNPFLAADVEAAIQQIQDNTDEIRDCLTESRLLTAATLHHQKDVRRIFKNGPRCDVDGSATDRVGKRYAEGYRDHERGTTPSSYQEYQFRTDNSRTTSHHQQIARIAKGSAICEKCASTDIRIVRRDG